MRKKRRLEDAHKRSLEKRERVLDELESIAFGYGHVTGKLKAMELLGKHIGFFTPKRHSGVERTSEEILSDIQGRLGAILK